MKKFLLLTASALAALTFAGCSGCAGCNSKTNNDALTSSNWYTGTSYKGIQPSSVIDNDFTPEKIVYTVTHSGGNNSTYSVEYKNGTFTTEFYATYYDWASSKIPEKYRSEGRELVYCYKTDLEISVRFKKGDKTTEWFDDSAVSVAYFRAAGKNLQPIYSSQDILSTTPAVYQAGEIEKCYEKVDVLYENFYSRDFTELTSVTYKNGETSEKVLDELNKQEYSLFDNSSLYIAARSLKLSTDLSQTISLFSAASGGISNYNIAGNSEPLSDEEQASAESILSAKELYKAEGENPKLNTVALNLVYASGELQGTTQTVWYAAVTNSDNNVSRATMLKISSPLSYALGTLTYNIKTIESTLWNG